jgi:hypothetical protein
MPWATRKPADPAYGKRHRELRAEWARHVAGGYVQCCRCRKLIRPGSPWHLDHSDHDRTVYNGPAHASCNVKAAARKARRKQTAERRYVPPGRRFSRAW